MVGRSTRLSQVIFSQRIHLGNCRHEHRYTYMYTRKVRV
jgi:hypothetical protein